jgi:hypothetical protein
MYKIIPWSNTLDLTEFYSLALEKGFVNNSNQHMLVDCFKNERNKQVWILYYNNIAVGSVASHSFDEMGENSYRIAVRTCVLSDLLPKSVERSDRLIKINGLRTINGIVNHQNITSQFLIPTCLEWVPKNSNLYITSNNNETGTQRLVHNIFGPAMEKTGQMKRIKDLLYRGTIQTIWQFFPDTFLEELNKNPRWK